MATRAEFMNDVYERAIALGIPEAQAQLAASQAALESNYGKAAPGNNYFGIKGKGQTFATHEVVDGKSVSQNASFRKYDDLDGSLKDWWGLVQRRWPDAATATSFDDAVSGLKAGGRGGYATDPNYGSKLNYAARKLTIPPSNIPSVATALDAVNTMGGDQTVSSGAFGYAPLPAPVAPYSRNTAFNPLPAPAPLTSTVGMSATERALASKLAQPVAPPNPLTGFGGMTGTAKTPEQLSRYKAAYRNSINGVQPISPTDASRYANSGSSRPAAPLQSLAPPPLPSRITPTDPGLPSFTPTPARSAPEPYMTSGRSMTPAPPKPSATPAPISAADASRYANSGSSAPKPITPTYSSPEPYMTSGKSMTPAAAPRPTVPMLTPKAGLSVPTSKTVANPAYAEWQSMYGPGSTSAGANALNHYMSLSKPPAPPAPPKTLTVAVAAPKAAAPAWNPLGDAMNWVGGKAGEIGTAVGGAAAAVPGMVDDAKGNIIKSILMSPEARSPFINGAIGAIGQNGRQYAGNGMVSALRLNHDTGEFERYLRKEVVPITKPGMQTYRDAAASTSSLSSNGPGYATPEQLAASKIRIAEINARKGLNKAPFGTPGALR